MPDKPFVIVGASLAGAKAAEELRERGYTGRIVLIGAERERPYERPPLTKDYLRGESPREKAYVHPEEFYADHDIELMTATEVTAIEPAAATISCSDANEIAYGRLLLATGAEPRRLTVDGAGLDGVNYLRTIDDCDALHQRLEKGASVVVIGAGWIGCECAASARQLGCDVTIVEPAAVPLERVLGAKLGAFYRDVHVDHGVRWLLDTGVESIEGDGAVERVRTTDGAALDCNLVVVGIGVAPRVQLAQDAGLEIDNGVAADHRLATSVPDVFAAGDIANAWHPFYERRVRVEHWANALNQGPAAARAMLGEDVSYDRIPYFYSDQYDVGMEYSGLADPGDEVVFRGDPAGREFIAFWLRDGVVVAGMNVNIWDVNDQVQELIRSRATIDVARLADPDVAIEQIVAEATSSSGR